MTSQDPLLIFLMETKLFVFEMDATQETLDRPEGSVVPSKGRSGGFSTSLEEGTSGGDSNLL